MRINIFIFIFFVLLSIEPLMAQSFVNSYETDQYGFPTKKQLSRQKENDNENSDDEESLPQAPLPPKAVKEKAPEISPNSHRLRFTTLASYTTVQGEQLSNGSIGILNSSLYPALKLDYTFTTPGWAFYILTGRKTIRFENSVDRTIITPEHTLYRFDLMFAKKFDRFAIGAGAGLEDKFFYKIVNTSFADADTSRDKKFYLFTELEFLRAINFKASINAKGGFNPKEADGIYDIQMGTFYSASLKIDHPISSNTNIGLEIYYKDEKYKTQQLKFESSEVGLGLSFSCDWGAGR